MLVIPRNAYCQIIMELILSKKHFSELIYMIHHIQTPWTEHTKVNEKYFIERYFLENSKYLRGNVFWKFSILPIHL